MKLFLHFQTLTLVLLLAVSVLAQQPAPTPTPDQALQHYRDSKAAILRDDFGQLARYRDANAALKPAAPGENRVIFFGDSITDLWKIEEYFPGKPYINRGISGQTTPQMLVRFRQDVIELHPKVVVSLAGTNRHHAGNTGPICAFEDIEANAMHPWRETSPAPTAFALCSRRYCPYTTTRRRSLNLFAGRPPEKILELNRWLKNYVTAAS